MFGGSFFVSLSLLVEEYAGGYGSGAHDGAGGGRIGTPYSILILLNVLCAATAEKDNVQKNLKKVLTEDGLKRLCPVTCVFNLFYNSIATFIFSTATAKQKVSHYRNKPYFSIRIMINMFF